MTVDIATSLFFTGHRNVPSEEKEIITKRVSSSIEVFIRKGYKTFICGGALGFDSIAAECVIEKKTAHPEIRLLLALPCRDQTAAWSDTSDLARYKTILGRADDIYYAENFYKKGCMHKRNRWMADNSSVCIAYLKTNRGGTAYTYKYAEDKGLQMINLGTDSKQLSFC